MCPPWFCGIGIVYWCCPAYIADCCDHGAWLVSMLPCVQVVLVVATVLAECSCCHTRARVALVVAATAADPAADPSADPAAGPEVVVDRLLPRTRTVILHLLTETTGLWVLERSCP